MDITEDTGLKFLPIYNKQFNTIDARIGTNCSINSNASLLRCFLINVGFNKKFILSFYICPFKNLAES